MTQMVLPQTPAPGMQNDAGASKSRPGLDKSADNKRYESVSRAEQRKMDRQQSGGKNTEPSKSAASGNQAKAPEKTGNTGKGEANSLQGKAIKAGIEAAGANSEELADMEATATPLTFSELQALLVPPAEQAASAGAITTTGPGTNNPILAPDAGLQPGLAGNKTGQPSLQLMDSVISGAGNKASNLESSPLLTGTRFESAIELVSQQNGSASASKLVAEAQVPLRSYATSVDVPVNHADWGDKLMGKLSWLTAKNLSVAEIHVTPPDMGPMEVRVRVQNEQANITVHAANPVVREQLELHSHRLRDMLGEQGLSLAQFDVSDNSRNSSGEQSSGQGGEDGSPAGSASALSGVDGSEEGVQVGSLDLSWNGAIDVFA